MSNSVSTTFLKAPVVETVLGMQFEPLKGFRNAHLGAFWKTLGPDWPRVEDAPALPQEFERFGAELVWARMGILNLRISQEPSSRLQIRNSGCSRMLQVQNGRLFYNWIREPGGDYPRHTALKVEFDAVVTRFKAFLATEGLGELRPNQWEVTYVNHLLKGTVWESPEDWVRLFPSMPSPPPALGNVGLESFGGEWHYEIRPRCGRLHVHVQHGGVGEEGEQKEALILKLTARGPAKNGDFDAGIALGHDTITSGFKSLASEAARRYWEEQP